MTHVEHITPLVKLYLNTSMLKPSLCDYGDAYILVKDIITVPNASAEGVNANNAYKKVIYKKCATFTDCMGQINNTQVDNTENINRKTKPIFRLINLSNCCITI